MTDVIEQSTTADGGRSADAATDVRGRAPGGGWGLGTHLHVSKRVIQIVLGLVWIVDAGLQFQPKMFGNTFVTMVIAPNAAGQPAAIGASITHMANFLSRDVALWNTLFGLTQLAIGLGILFRRTLRPALAASFLWAFGVWWFGEGFGGIFTGHATALMGAPGAVLLYALIGVTIWPRRADSPAVDTAPADVAHRATGADSSVAASGPLGRIGALGVWAAVWVFFAVLQLMPQNRQSDWLHRAFTSMASGQPGWYAHLLNSLGHAFTGAGTPIAVLLAAGFLAIGIGPFVSRRGDLFIAGGMALGLLFWCTGQAFGMILTGMSTDPNSGPLLALLGAALLPTVLDPIGTPVLLTLAFERRRQWATVGVIALVVVPLAVAVIPEASGAAVGRGPANVTSAVIVASPSSSSAGASAMPGMSMSPGTGSGGAATGTHSSSKPMNMAAMAGLGVTDPGWKYTGPTIPATEVGLLTSIGGTTDLGHAMQTPSCTKAPTSDQVLGAVSYVQSTSAAVAKYKDLSVAVAAGYRPITNPAYPIVHYLNFAYMNSHDIMNPNAVDSLVYAFTPYGPVLVAAMYLLPSEAAGPMPYGCLVQWHAHTNLCFSKATHTIVGFTPCTASEYQIGARTPYMTHVWQVPVSGGPLAIDPSDLQVMQAAIMAQQQGLAPTTTPVPATSA